MVNGQKSWPWPWHPRFYPWSMVKLTNFDHLTTVILEFWPWSWSKMAIFDHLITAILKFWPWSWSKIFDHLTMTPGRRPNGQKIVVILPPPPPPPPLICTFLIRLDVFSNSWFLLTIQSGLFCCLKIVHSDFMMVSLKGQGSAVQ